MDLETVLRKDFHTWTSNEVDTVCQSFIRACDNQRNPAGYLLTTRLWRYWFFICKEKPLLDEPKYNMALMLGAQAIGEFVPQPGNGNFFGRYRLEHSEFEKTLEPPQLSWGPRAIISAVSSPTIDSAIIQACVFRANSQISEILIVGQGVPELRQEIFQAVFSCQLRGLAGDLDMINADACRILAPNANHELFDLPGVPILGSSTTMMSPAGYTAADVLSELVQKLKSLQERTELVVVHECDALVKQEFDDSLRHCARETANCDHITIVAKNPLSSSLLANQITIAPYYQLARRPLPLQVVLDPAIIKIPSFEDLLKAFTYHTVERIRADAKVRQETYEKRAADLKDQQRRWREADNRMRKELWGEVQSLSELFNEETGTIIRLAQPREVPTAVYMEVNVPSLIEDFERWAEQMRKITRDLTEATERPDTPILRLAASRFLDAALRDRGHLVGDAELRKHFDRWRNRTAPFLRFQWRTALETKRINPNSVFNRQTAFHTRFRVDDLGNISGLVMQPFAIISPTHSAIIFDPNQPAMIVRSPSDYAQPYEAESPRPANALWQELEQAASRPGANQNEFVSQLRAKLLESPAELLPKLVVYLTQASKPETDQIWEPALLINEHPKLIDKIHFAAFPSKIVTLVSQRAFHSARLLIQETKVTKELKVRMIPWRILVECLAHNQTPVRFIPSLIRGRSWPPSGAPEEVEDEILRLLNKARACDPGFVREWTDRLNKSDGLQQAILLLRRDWMTLEQHVSTPQRHALYQAERAVESAFLARTLEGAAQAIASGGETTASVLIKIGQSLEDLLLTETGAVPFSDVLALIEILIGKETTVH